MKVLNVISREKVIVFFLILAWGTAVSFSTPAYSANLGGAGQGVGSISGKNDPAATPPITSGNKLSNQGGGLTSPSAAPTPGSSCSTINGKAGRWFGTPGNITCCGLGDSCPAPNGPGKVFGTPTNMTCAGLGDSCPGPNGPG